MPLSVCFGFDFSPFNWTFPQHFFFSLTSQTMICANKFLTGLYEIYTWTEIQYASEMNEMSASKWAMIRNGNMNNMFNSIVDKRELVQQQHQTFVEHQAFGKPLTAHHHPQHRPKYNRQPTTYSIIGNVRIFCKRLFQWHFPSVHTSYPSVQLLVCIAHG